ncbi:putative integral membrane protein [Pseudonocardia hierapolitana]|uniref:Putative integral membrane protein n=1 Tax=Pseudonocardia hierapolitana TaxID=1128676 RepID=A0A561T572_9PSEU|nr:lipopolysaccharide assembly protein LapA domain-containing protein [Pseudonocardia hierapolitana]TWF82249.1 putative integral membrane protein [Pseudonocardia hierapolitana]
MNDKPQTTNGKSDMAGTRAAPRSRISGLWVGLILSAIVLAFLLIFVLQNGNPVQITFLAWTGTLPTGVALLFAAVAGVLLVAVPGSIRILQVRRTATDEPARAGRTSHLA